MNFIVKPSQLRGSIQIPGSKSHTIRGVLIASLAAGESRLQAPLESADTQAAVSVYTQLGAQFSLTPKEWRIQGIDGLPKVPDVPLNVLNSGTTLRVAMGSCALLPQYAGTIQISGDPQIQRRPCGPLIQALNQLGAEVTAERSNDCAPFRIRGRLNGGKVTIEAKSSQYLTSLLLACPLAPKDTEIQVSLLHEKPYVQMTLNWLRQQGIKLEQDGWSRFFIPGGQQFQPVNQPIPADFSTAAFLLVAGAMGENDILCRGLDLSDSQSDRAILDFLREMGAEITITNEGIRVSPHRLEGIEADLNDCPDLLPVMAILGTRATGETRLVNVPQARIKETDRIAVMCREIQHLGGDAEELEDGLIIRHSRLRSGTVNGHHDHRVVMALTILGTQIKDGLRISTAEAVGVTFPDFPVIMRRLGADLIED